MQFALGLIWQEDILTDYRYSGKPNADVI